MPLNSDGPKLGSSNDIAMRRFLNLEKKLNSDLLLKESYAAFIQEFIDFEHLERLPNDQNYFLSFANRERLNWEAQQMEVFG